MQDPETVVQTDLSGPAADVPDRVINSYRKTPYKANVVALEKQLDGTRITRKGVHIPRSLHFLLKWWLQEENILQGQPRDPTVMLWVSLQMHQKKGRALT